MAILKPAVRRGPYLSVAALGAVTGLALSLSWPAQRLEWALYDRMTAAATRVPQPPPDIAVIAIDEPSFAELKLQWPWPRSVHAALIDALARDGAKTIVFDLIPDTATSDAEDQALAAAMTRAGNVILASDLTETANPAYAIQQWVEPIPALAAAATRVAAATVPLDPDGAVRRVPLAVDGRPTLGTAAALFANPSLHLSDLESPRLIRFLGPPRQGLTTVSYYQALQPGLLPADFFRGKTVFIGRSLSAAAALDQPDHFRTPVAARHPAVELHASLFAMIEDGRGIRDPFASLAASGAFSLGIALACALVLYPFDAPVGLAMLAALSLSMIAAAYALLAEFDTRVPAVGPLVAMAGVFVAAAAYRFTLGRRERALIKRAFEHYVSPAIVGQMLADPSRLKVGGENVDASVMFTDLEGFTTIAEGLAPQELRDRLSAYFSAMVAPLLAERATLDKFIGDAIMAYFGCPIADASHPAQACRAALAMQRRLDALNAEWRADGVPPLRMRIGINTGAVVAGNMGTDTIFNFTILGDCVNIAARLEGANKEYGTSILVGEETWSRVRDQFEFRDVGRITLRGKTKPIAIFELLAEK